MKRPLRARPGGASGELQIAPLIDCVFLLLTYFLFTISLSTIEGLLPSELALGDEEQQQTDPEEHDDEVVVRLIKSGARVQYFIDDWPASDYGAVSKHLSGLGANAIVVIDAGPTVEYEHVIRLYNKCLQLEIDRVVFPLEFSGAT